MAYYTPEVIAKVKELDLYTRSMEYIKDMANKLGLVYENEIIFKESGE